MRRTTGDARGARASNAGDEFHFRYSARLALRVLDPNSGLTALRIEHADDVVDSGTRYLGVDTAEFYGGESLSDSVRVVSNQLKFSPSHPDQGWTTARLCLGRGRSGASVIRRLAGDFRDFVASSSIDEVRSKLHIRLISNQAVDHTFQQAFTEVKRALSGLPIGVLLRRLKNELSPDSVAMVERLHSESALGSAEFCDFLRLLDFSGCNQPGLALQDALMTQEAGPFMGDDGQALRRLVDAIRDLALPNRHGRPLKRLEVLACLGVPFEEDLFPAPSLIAPLKDPITTADVTTVAEALAGNQRVLAYGPAGIGKTSTIQLLEGVLPIGSVVAVYDCWGGGSCFEYGGARHTHSRAIRQIINEVSARVGLPLLVGKVSTNEDFEGRLKRRLKAASEAVGIGILVLVIDAADNAAVAATNQGSTPFTQNLWSLPLPDNCRLLMTARYHRKELLQPTPEVAQVELQGFDCSGSTTHLQRVFPNASQHDGEVFHQVTGGNPRLQSYKLSGADPREPSLTYALDPRLGTIEAIFDDLFRSTTTQFGNQVEGVARVAGLLCMPRPIDIQEYAANQGITSEAGRSFISGLDPGVVVSGTSVNIRDEDFDAFLRSKLSVSDVEQAHKRACDRITANGVSSPYAARAIAEHLNGAGRYADLVALAFSQSGLLLIKDEILRLEVQRRRIGLALRSTVHTNRPEEAVRLLLLAGMSSKTDYSLSEIIRSRPDLAAAFGDPESVAQVVMRSSSDAWFGSAHLHAAAYCARKPEFHERAYRHLEEADAWLRVYFSKPQNERHNWDLTARDIARGAEAMYYLSGPEAAARQVQRWRPLAFQVEVVTELADMLVTSIPWERICGEICALQRPTWVDLIFALALWRNGKLASPEILERATLSARRKPPKRGGILDPGYDYVGLAEARCQAGLDAATTKTLLERHMPKLPEDLRYRYRDYSEIVLPIRAHCLLRSIDGEQITVSSFVAEYTGVDSAKRRNDQRDSQIREAVNPVLNVVSARAQSICSRVPGTAEALIRGELATRRSGEREYGEPSNTYSHWSLLAYDVLLRQDQIPTELLKEIAWGIVDSDGLGAITHWPRLARRLIAADLPLLGAEILEKLLVEAENLKLPARELWDLLLDAAGVALRCDEALSHDLYRRAVDAAEAVDDDSGKLLQTLADITAQCSLRPQLASREPELAARLVHLVELIRPFISESKYVPTIGVLTDISELWPDGSLVVAARWRDLGMPYGYLFVPVLAEALAEGNYLEPEISLALLSLAGEQATSSHYGLSMLDKLWGIDPNRVKQAYLAFGQTVLMGSSGSDRIKTLQRVLTWGQVHHLGLSDLFHRLEEEIRIAATLPHPQSSVMGYESDMEKEVAELLQLAEPASGKDLLDVLEKLFKATWSWSHIEPFAKIIADRTPYSKRVEMLSSVSSVAEDSYRVKYVCEMLSYLLEAWLQYPVVATAAPDIVGDFFVRRALEYPFFEDAREPAFVRLMSIVGPGLDLHKAIVTVVSSQDDHIGLVTAYAFATLLCRRLDDQAFEDVLDWTFVQLEEHLGASTVDAPLLNVAGPESWREATAGFLWRLMSDPSRPTRWLAIRAARSIVRFDGALFLAELCQKLGAHDAGPFELSGSDSFWMSGRAMLLVLLQRLADECPSLVAPFVPILVSITKDRSFPHAQIREIARQAIFTLVERGVEITAGEMEAVSLANRPSCCKWPRDRSYTSRDRFSPDEETKFQFNGLDTIPYWFHPLDRAFGDPLPNTLARADKWISEVWQRTNEDIANYRKRAYDSDGEDTYHSHGHMPTREVLQTHLEFHAMMCAAGEMADEGLCISVSDYDEPGDPWLEFLDEHLVLDPHYWLGDFREPLPAEKWIRDLERLIGQESHDIDLGPQIAGLTPAHIGELLFDGQDFCSTYSGYVSVRTRAACVSPESARALCLLANDSDSFVFELPIDDRTEVADAEAGFTLLPAVFYNDSRSCLDTFDPQNAQGIGSVPRLASAILEKCKLKPGIGHRTYISEAGEIVGRVEWWDETKRSRRGDQHGHSGKRLWLDRKTVLDYLRAIGMDLLLVTDVSFDGKHDQSKKENRSRRERSHAFIVRADGSIEDLRAG